ncbi:hypothetical protein ACFVMC_26850 [Nocardia sp. NPDC127579]|uniref:hypothetical protein n=1 Tax=Nocardia sp. NPDC127579 TaxID=3345402 RepID=UPI00363ED2F8
MKLAADFEFAYASVEDAEQLAVLYDRAYGGTYTIVDCLDPVAIRRIVSGGEHIWVIARADGAVVSAIVARPEPAQRAYEICRAAVLPEYAGRGGFGGLFAMTVNTAISRPDCELIYGHARSERARRAFIRNGYPMAWVGTDGGMHRVGGAREEHLTCVAFNAYPMVTRVRPEHPLIDPKSTVAHEVMRLLGHVRTGAYPSSVVAGRTGELVHESSHGRVTYTLAAPIAAMEIDSVQTSTPADTRRALWAAIDDAPTPVEHVTVRVLADKVEVITELCRPHDDSRRFAARAYLPGWYSDGALRYDCVALVAYTAPYPPIRLGLDDRVEAIHRSFPTLLR